MTPWITMQLWSLLQTHVPRKMLNLQLLDCRPGAIADYAHPCTWVFSTPVHAVATPSAIQGVEYTHCTNAILHVISPAESKWWYQHHSPRWGFENTHLRSACQKIHAFWFFVHKRIECDVKYSLINQNRINQNRMFVIDTNTSFTSNAEIQSLKTCRVLWLFQSTSYFLFFLIVFCCEGSSATPA